MNVDLGQLKKDGFIILREVIPPDQLEGLRKNFETLVDRQREIWARDREPGDPPGGVWEADPQPRLRGWQNLIDETTADTMEFCLHENTRGVNRQLMQAEEASNTGIFMMCNPVRDHGPAKWHRDIHPMDEGPLLGLQIDLLKNAPGYLQWNIPLYDDDVLWVIPGSHRRSNTDEENCLLGEDPCVPLPNGLQVELKAGDGVVYTNTILHWGSNYGTKLRRTVHLGYRSFGGPVFPYVPGFVRDLGFTRYLSESGRQLYDRLAAFYAEECDTITSLLRAVLDKDVEPFQDALARLHPAEPARIVCLILISKLVYKLRFDSHPKQRNYLRDWTQHEVVGPRFSQKEIDTLWQRFSALDARLRSDEEQFVPGFQSGPMEYVYQDLPEDFDVEEFIASW